MPIAWYIMEAKRTTSSTLQSRARRGGAMAPEGTRSSPATPASSLTRTSWPTDRRVLLRLDRSSRRTCHLAIRFPIPLSDRLAARTHVRLQLPPDRLAAGSLIGTPGTRAAHACYMYRNATSMSA